MKEEEEEEEEEEEMWRSGGREGKNGSGGRKRLGGDKVWGWRRRLEI